MNSTAAICRPRDPVAVDAPIAPSGTRRQPPVPRNPHGGSDHICAVIPKAYWLLRTVLMTAIDDGVLAENPCRVKGAGSERVVERSIRPSRRWKSSSMRSSPAIGLRSCSPRIAGCARESARTWRADTSSWKQSAPRHLTSVSSGRLVGGELPFVVPAAALRAGWFDLSVSFHAAEPLENGFSGEVQFGGEVLGGAWSGAEE